MRTNQRVQTSLFDHYVEHEIGKELKNMSRLLDEHREVLDWVEKDIQTVNLKDESGRKGMTVEIRCYHQRKPGHTRMAIRFKFHEGALLNWFAKKRCFWMRTTYIKKP